MRNLLLFSIVIANYNKGDNIKSLLESVYRDAGCMDFEVLFMDDRSSDCSVTVAETFPVRIFRSEERVGPATLRNKGASEATGEYLLFLDSDVILPAGSLQKFRSLCLAGEFGSVSGLEVLPPVIDNWIGWFRTLQVQDHFGRHCHEEGLLDAWGSTCGGVRRELFFRAGGFNEAYRGADVEDHALAIKLKCLGPMIFSPFVTYRHSYPSTIELVFKQFRRASQMIQLDNENGSVLQHTLLFRWRFKLGHILSVSIVAVCLVLPFLPGFGSVLLALCTLKFWINWYLFSRAFQLKGFLFMVYTFIISLIMGVSIVCGAFYGKVRQAIS